MYIYACMHFWFCLPTTWQILASSLLKVNLQMGIESAERVHCRQTGLKLRTLRLPLLPALLPQLDNFLSFPFSHLENQDMNPHLYLIMFQRELINSSCALCAQEFTIRDCTSICFVHMEHCLVHIIKLKLQFTF